METIFLTLGAPFFRHEGRLFIEAQTASGLKAWQREFSRVITCSICHAGPPPAGWIDAETAGLVLPEYELIELPDGYRMPTYVKTRPQVKALLRDALRRADYRLFAIGGWIGDWGIFGARLAAAEGLSHGIWFDRVESQVFATTHDGSLKGRLRAWLKSRITAAREDEVLAKADLALLHGQTVFDQFRDKTRNPQIVEDIHLEESDRIPAEALQRKLSGAATDVLRIRYVGRADRMKGGLLWVLALEALARAGVQFEAEWAGDGPQLEEMRQQVAQAELADRVVFHGFVSDRQKVLEILRGAHVLMFCHMTDESPRNLIEALHAATPLVGFRDTYAQRLVSERGAGCLVDRGDAEALARAVVSLNADRAALRDLIEKASQSGRHLTRSQVFADRARIVRDNLGYRREAA